MAAVAGQQGGRARKIRAREQKPEAMHRSQRPSSSPFLSTSTSTCTFISSSPSSSSSSSSSLSLSTSCYCFCHTSRLVKLRLAFRACFSFYADIYFAVINFKLHASGLCPNCEHSHLHSPVFQSFGCPTCNNFLPISIKIYLLKIYRSYILHGVHSSNEV